MHLATYLFLTTVWLGGCSKGGTTQIDGALVWVDATGRQVTAGTQSAVLDENGILWWLDFDTALPGLSSMDASQMQYANAGDCKAHTNPFMFPVQPSVAYELTGIDDPGWYARPNDLVAADTEVLSGGMAHCSGSTSAQPLIAVSDLTFLGTDPPDFGFTPPLHEEILH